MRGLLAPLSPNEETALRKVGLSDREPLALEHIRRLLQLDLIQWNGLQWALTGTGQRRYAGLAFSEDANRKDA